MDSLHQSGHMFWWRVLMDAMPQIENVGGSCLGAVGVRFAKAVQNPNHFFFDAFWGCKQHIGVDVALQCFPSSAHLAAHHGAGFAQVHGPVETQDFAVELAHFVQPQAATFGEHNARNLLAFMVCFELGEHQFGVFQAELLESAIGHHAAPTVKNHHGLSACVNLGIQVVGHREGVDFQNAMHQVGSAVHQTFDQPVVV